jgi:tRNA U34 5-carboxymethylaminomethyl modifying GTPase MnmE/TrmE
MQMHQFAQTRRLSSRQMTASTADGGVVLVGNPNVGKSVLFGR